MSHHDNSPPIVQHLAPVSFTREFREQSAIHFSRGFTNRFNILPRLEVQRVWRQTGKMLTATIRLDVHVYVSCHNPKKHHLLFLAILFETINYTVIHESRVALMDQLALLIR